MWAVRNAPFAVRGAGKGHSRCRQPLRSLCRSVPESAAGIHAFVVFFVFSAGDVVHPFLVVEIPAYGFLNALLGLQGGFPSQFFLEFGGVDGLACSVSRAVGDEGDEV